MILLLSRGNFSQGLIYITIRVDHHGNLLKFKMNASNLQLEYSVTCEVLPREA